MRGKHGSAIRGSLKARTGSPPSAMSSYRSISPFGSTSPDIGKPRRQPMAPDLLLAYVLCMFQ